MLISCFDFVAAVRLVYERVWWSRPPVSGGRERVGRNGGRGIRRDGVDGGRKRGRKGFE